MIIIGISLIVILTALGLWAAADKISDLETRVYLLEEAYKLDLKERMKEKGIDIKEAEE